jgi:hypothetical protein
VQFIINPSQLGCVAMPDGSHHCTLEFRTFAYDADGALVNLQANVLSGDIPGAKYADLFHRNLGYFQQISVPVKGEYFLRIGVRDASNDRVGALELPVAAVAGLKPLEAPGTAPAAAAAPK